MFSLSTSFSHRIVVFQLEYNGEMKNYFKNQYLQLLRNQGNKAGIVPVENTENEVESCRGKTSRNNVTRPEW